MTTPSPMVSRHSRAAACVCVCVCVRVCDDSLWLNTTLEAAPSFVL